MSSIKVSGKAISTSIQEANEELVKHGYSRRTIATYVSIWKHVESYAGEIGATECSKELLIEFSKKRYNIENVFNPTSDKEKYYARFLMRLYESCYEGIWITHRSYKIAAPFKSQSFVEVYKTFKNNLHEKKLKPSSIALKMQIVRDFLNFLESRSITDSSNVMQMDVLKYIESKSLYSSAHKSSIIITLREFFSSPNQSGKFISDFSIYLRAGNFRSHYEKMPSGYTEDEIRKMLSCIDRKTPEGKKDYVFILLGVDLGLRVSDIINLKISDIKWNVSTIELVQQKTGEFISLPLTDNLKWALLDYLKNSRPNRTEHQNIFFRSLAPYCPYISGGHYYKRLNKYFKLARINTEGKHHGMHSLRHSLAARLMSDNIPITIISETLGHKYTNVTRDYIRIDIEKLRLVALEVPSNV